MKIELRQVFLYAIAPALIAGFFSVAPKIYEIAVEPKATLTYSIVTGPQIAIDSTQQQVISIRVSNSGKRPLTLLKAELSVDSGTVVAYTLTNTSGLNIQAIKAEDHITVTIPKVHPGEDFSISALLKTAKPTIEPKFVLRSDEVLGTAEALTPQEQSIFKTIQSGALAAFSVFAMALFALRRGKSGGLSFREDVIFYIATTINIDALVAYASIAENEPTYMRFADMLLAAGRCNDEANRHMAIKGLMCLLLVKNMAAQSLSIVERNLRILQGSDFDAKIVQELRQKSVSSNNIVELRNMIDELVAKSNVVPAKA